MRRHKKTAVETAFNPQRCSASEVESLVLFVETGFQPPSLVRSRSPAALKNLK
ncbi:hypothetical protein QUA44_20225 [Microcoleus sp. N9_A2]|uniref:hypothetical protein n=1 Tax=unclassified Microcoleus TaxID=2642155 RepID=UPI002FD0F6EE